MAKTIHSQHEIELGEYDGHAVFVRMGRDGKTAVSIGPLVDVQPEKLLKLTLDAIGAAALLRKHAG